MTLTYQFNICFVEKTDQKQIKYAECITYSNEYGNFLHESVGVVLSHYRYRGINDLRADINAIKQGKANHPDGYIITDEGTAGLLIQGDKTKILDLMHTHDGIIDGIKGPINFNISTPEVHQYVPTEFILQLLSEWYEFLIKNSTMHYVPQSWIKEEFIPNLE